MATIEPNFESICIDPNDDLVLYKKEIVRSRIEKFLYAICSLDNDDLPTPLSRIEELYNCLVTGGDIPIFTPLSRAEKFVMAMLGAYDVELLPTPISRSETLMKKIATGDNNLDDIDNLQSRYEFLLAYIIKAGGFNGSNGDFYYKLTSLTSGFTTIYGTLDKPVKNAVLKGQTLVNVLSATNIKVSSKSAKVIEFNVQPNVQKRYVLFFKLNKIPTISDNSDNAQFLKFEWYHASASGGFYSLQNKNVVLDKTITINIPSYTGVIQRTNFSVWCRFFESGELDMDVMIIEYQEGMENWDIPYFTGIQSVKMPVLKTTGKNLFNKNNIIVDGYIISNGRLVYETGDNRNASDFIEVEPNCIYRISGIKNSAVNGGRTHQYVGMYDKNKEFISSTTIYCLSDSETFTTTENTKYIRVSVRNDDINRLQIEKGTTATTYEPHKSTAVSCNEEVELRGIGDIKDELNLVTGEYTKAIYEYTFTGNEHWDIGGATSGYTYFQCKLNQLPINYKYTTDANIPISCNRLPVITYNDFDGRLKNVGINLTYFFRLNFSDCDSNNGATVEDLKAYLKTNPTTVQYPISKSVKTVDLLTLDQDGKETKLSTFDDITHVTVSSEGLIPTGDIDIARPIQFVDYSLDDALTTLYNTIEHPVKSAILKGNTLKNLSSLTGVTTLKPGNAIFVENTGMKTNTTYTIMFNCSNVPSTDFVEIRTMMDNTQITQVQQNVSAGYNKFAIKTHTSKETNRFRFKNDTTSTTDFFFSELVILEGDYTNIDIPYFTGMQSVKIPVLCTTGKNLFYSTLESGDFNPSTGIPNNNSKSIVRTKEYNEISPNKTYRITVFNSPSTLSTFTVYQYDNDFNFIKRTDSNVLTTNANTKYVKFRFRQSDNSEFTEEELAALSCMITEGDTIPNTYEPYKSNILTTSEEVVLRSLSNGVKDTLNCMTGEYIQHIKEFVLDGSSDEPIGITNVEDTTLIRFNIDNVEGVQAGNTNEVLCDLLPYLHIHDLSGGSAKVKQECISNHSQQANMINIIINQSRLSSVSVEGFRAYLQSNPITIQYSIKTPIVKTVTLSTLNQDGKETKLKTFDDITHVTVSSEGLIPTGEITVATKNATDVVDASVMSLRMDDILNSQETLEGSVNAQSDDIDATMLGTTDIYEQLL